MFFVGDVMYVDTITFFIIYLMLYYLYFENQN